MVDEIYSDFEEPWCQSLLSDPNIEDITAPGRGPPPPRDARFTNLFFTETLHGPRTIRAWKSLRRRETEADSLSPRYMLLLSLGAGLGGMDKVLHGGVVASILGQSMWIAATVTFGPLVTKEVHRRYKSSSISLPGVVICRSFVSRRKGRAVWVQGVLEDSKGSVSCEAEALYVIQNSSKGVEGEAAAGGPVMTGRLERL